MKKSLLTLSLVVGFASVVSATEGAKTPSRWENFKNATAKYVPTKRQALIGAGVVAGSTGLGFGGYKLYKNPKMVRTAGKFAQKHGVRGLNFVKANKLATGLSLGTTVAAVLGYKYWNNISAFGTKWVVAPAKKAWTNRPAWMLNKKTA